MKNNVQKRGSQSHAYIIDGLVGVVHEYNGQGHHRITVGDGKPSGFHPYHDMIIHDGYAAVTEYYEGTFPGPCFRISTEVTWDDYHRGLMSRKEYKKYLNLRLEAAAELDPEIVTEVP